MIQYPSLAAYPLVVSSRLSGLTYSSNQQQLNSIIQEKHQYTPSGGTFGIFSLAHN
jgi:hypothetical protein